MNALDQRVCIVTGAGRGIGRAHALFLAAEGARVVVNDVGSSADGEGSDQRPAEAVVRDIREAGGDAVANFDDVADFDGAQRLVEQAVDTYGDLHVLVNNAGILRQSYLADMPVEDWDAVVRVHMRGSFAPTRHAAAHWRDQREAGSTAKRAVINTTSNAGLFGNLRQAHYGAAKLAITAFTAIADAELGRYGVRVNAIAPAAATRLSLSSSPPVADDAWNPRDARNISPFVAYLATEDCPIHGRIFMIEGSDIHLVQPFAVVATEHKEGRWTVEELRQRIARLQDIPFDLGHARADRMSRDAAQAAPS